MEEIILPNVGKLAVVGRDLGQNRLCRYRKEGVRLREAQTVTLGFVTLREVPLPSLVFGKNCSPSCN